MKIGPPNTTPAARPLRLAADAPSLPDRPTDQAAGFEELGMFGLARSKAAPKSDQPPTLKSGAGREQAGELQTLRCPPALSGKPSKSPTPRPGGAHADNPSPRPALKSLGPNAAAPVIDGDGATSTPATPDATVATAEGEAAAGAPVRRAVPRPATQATVSLTLHEQDGMVEIVAAAPSIDPEARLELRRLIQDLLSRSGLALAHFQLNGAPLGPDSQAKTGGSHGTRAN